MQKLPTELTQSQAKKVEKILLKIKSRTQAESRQLVDIYFTLGKYLQTINLIEQGFTKYAHWQHELPLLLLLSRAYCCLNRFKDGLLVLEQSVQLDRSIDNAEAVLGLVQLYGKEFNLCKVEDTAPLLLKWQDYYLPGLLALIKNASRLGDKYLLTQRLLLVRPYYQSISNPVELCTLMWHCGLVEESHKLLLFFETNFNQTLPEMHAGIAIAKSDYDQVVTLLTDTKIKTRPVACYQKALALDKLGEFAQAFAYLSKGAALRQSEFGGSNNRDLLPFFKLAEDPHFITKIQETSQPVSDFSHAFIFGFPRSGTTLLDNVLDTQAGLKVASELPMLFFVKQAIVESMGYKYPDDLATLNNHDLELLRSLYITKAKEMGLNLNANDILIDKGPHHTIDLPLIKLLFPQAKLILCLRHPLDVCLSCFQQDFEPNNNNQKLIGLNKIVMRYEQVFLLLEKYSTSLGIDFLSVKYEELVQDFDQQIIKVFDFLDYQPVEDYSKYYQHAAQKYVQSASRGQTNQPLYTSSLYKWCNYAEQLKPFIPQLTYFIDKFGYESNVNRIGLSR